MQVRTRVRELQGLYYKRVLRYLRRLQVVELHEAQAMWTMLTMEFGPAVEMRLREIDKDRQSLIAATGIEESTLSKLIRGRQTPSLHQITVIEAALELRRGHFLRLAGFVDDSDKPTLEQLISHDSRFNLKQRSALLQIVNDAVVANYGGEPAAIRPLDTAPTKQQAARKRTRS